MVESSPITAPRLGSRPITDLRGGHAALEAAARDRTEQ
jgi:hypothetical protein